MLFIFKRTLSDELDVAESVAAKDVTNGCYRRRRFYPGPIALILSKVLTKILLCKIL